MESVTNTLERKPETDRAILFEELYKKAFPPFARYASKMNASLQDAKDVFHDALLVYYEKSLDPDFSPTTSAEAYVLGTARHLWFRKFRQQRQHIPLDDALPDVGAPTDVTVANDAERRLLAIVERTGKRCLELLSKFYFEKATLAEIASRLGYRTEHSAAVQKYKCIGKVRDEIKAKSIRYEDFHN